MVVEPLMLSMAQVKSPLCQHLYVITGAKVNFYADQCHVCRSTDLKRSQTPSGALMQRLTSDTSIKYLTTYWLLLDPKQRLR